VFLAFPVHSLVYLQRPTVTLVEQQTFFSTRSKKARTVKWGGGWVSRWHCAFHRMQDLLMVHVIHSGELLKLFLSSTLPKGNDLNLSQKK
jgi:hypothetical protein